MMQDAYDGYVVVSWNEMRAVASTVLKTKEAIDAGTHSVAHLIDDERRTIREAFDVALRILGI